MNLLILLIPFLLLLQFLNYGTWQNHWIMIFLIVITFITVLLARTTL